MKAQQGFFDAKIFLENELIKQFKNTDSSTFHKTIQGTLNKWVYNGYLLANIDSIERMTQTRNAYLFKGDKVTGVHVLKVDAPVEVMPNMSSLTRLKSKPKSIPVFTSRVQKSLTWLANNGYPFAELNIEVLSLKHLNLVCNIKIDKGPLVVYDSVVVFGDVKLSRSFLKYFLGISKGEPYNEKKVQNINDRLSSLNYLTLEQDPIVLFQKSKATLIIRVKEVQANKVNALLGLAPQSGNNSNKLLLTGMADIGLVNLTGNREEVKLNWQSFLGNSQSLKTSFSIPYIPYLNLGTSLGFALTKFDSNYLQTQTKVGLDFFSASNFKWSVFYSSDVTSLLSTDTSRIRASFSFPAINATTSNAYGIKVEKMKWRNQFNPWKGYFFSINGSAGTKRINRDNRIEQVQVTVGGRLLTLYDSLPLRFNQYLLESELQFVQPLKGKKVVLYNRISSGFNLSEEIFFQDLYRMGGYGTLKGFDEQSLFANQFVSGLVELRYRFNDLSNAFVFMNGMYLKNESTQFVGHREDFPFGFGLGANLNTGSTVLSVAYGYGIQKGIPLNINQGKFHFGLVSYF